MCHNMVIGAKNVSKSLDQNFGRNFGEMNRHLLRHLLNAGAFAHCIKWLVKLKLTHYKIGLFLFCGASPKVAKAVGVTVGPGNTN